MEYSSITGPLSSAPSAWIKVAEPQTRPCHISNPIPSAPLPSSFHPKPRPAVSSGRWQKTVPILTEHKNVSDSSSPTSPPRRQIPVHLERAATSHAPTGKPPSSGPLRRRFDEQCLVTGLAPSCRAGSSEEGGSSAAARASLRPGRRPAALRGPRAPMRPPTPAPSPSTRTRATPSPCPRPAPSPILDPRILLRASASGGSLTAAPPARGLSVRYVRRKWYVTGSPLRSMRDRGNQEC